LRHEHPRRLPSQRLTKSLEARILAEVKQEGTHTFGLSSYVTPSRFKAVKIKKMPVDAETIRELRIMFPHITLASPQTYIFSQQMMIKVGTLTRRIGFLTAMVLPPINQPGGGRARYPMKPAHTSATWALGSRHCG
jgi:hypothetical protein